MACEHNDNKYFLCRKCDNVSIEENRKENVFVSLYLQDIDGETWLMAYCIDKNEEKKIAKVCKFE